MRLQPIALAKAFAWMTGIVYSLCALAIIYFPDLAMGIAQSWFHGIDISLIQSFEVSLESFITGLITSMLAAWLAGYLLAGFYNYFARK